MQKGENGQWKLIHDGQIYQNKSILERQQS